MPPSTTSRSPCATDLVESVAQEIAHLHETGRWQLGALLRNSLMAKLSVRPPGGQRDHAMTQGGRHLDALDHAGTLGRSRIGLDHCRPVVPRMLMPPRMPRRALVRLAGHFLTPRHADGDFQSVLGQQARGCLADVVQDVLPAAPD